MLTEDQILSSTFGLSFWPVPTTAAMQAGIAAQFGDPTSAYWMSECALEIIEYMSDISLQFLRTQPQTPSG